MRYFVDILSLVMMVDRTRTALAVLTNKLYVTKTLAFLWENSAFKTQFQKWNRFHIIPFTLINLFFDASLCSLPLLTYNRQQNWSGVLIRSGNTTHDDQAAAKWIMNNETSDIYDHCFFLVALLISLINSRLRRFSRCI